MGMFDFLRKKPKISPPQQSSGTEDDMARLHGFFCRWCGAALFDFQTDCLVCKTPYSQRASEIVAWRNEAKRRLAKKLDYGDIAHLLKATTENLAKNPSLLPAEAFRALFVPRRA